MANLLNKLQQLARLVSGRQIMSKSERPKALPDVHDALDAQVVQNLMDMLEQTQEQEYSCEETFALLDEYVELAANSAQAAMLMPLVKHHIDMCVDCRDQFEVLLQILQRDHSNSEPV